MFAVKRRRARLPLMVAALEAAAVATMGSTVFAQALTKEQPQAAPPGVVVIRAVGPHFSDEAIQYVAQNTLPTRFDNDIAATLQKKSARDVIAKMCGDLRRAYTARS